MRLFQRKRPHNLSPRQKRMAHRLAGRITALQQKLATWLNSKTANLSGKAWLLLLILFTALFGAYCLHLLVLAFS